MKTPAVEILPEFRVELSRKVAANLPHYEMHGRRTKLGGKPDWEQNCDETPRCRGCKRAMTFVAQIDSVEHDGRSNPHAVDAISPNQKWMLGDVGMIYVFFCFKCLQTKSVFQCG